MVARDRKLLGVVEGNQQAQIAGYMLKGNASAAEGDIIITSGMGTYPAGLEIGTIKTITYNSDTLLKEITVEPAADFRSLKKVSVIL
ncbi:MAG: rod shape-determining protein MreC, partial [Anaerovoracaceae bacterium]